MSGFSCCVCLESIPRRGAITCSHPPLPRTRYVGLTEPRIHHTCGSCVAAMVKIAIEKMEINLVCQSCEGPPCKGTLRREAVRSVMDKSDHGNMWQKFLNIPTLKTNPHLRECPRCCVLVQRKSWGNKMECSDCKFAFCFLHGMVHNMVLESRAHFRGCPRG
jgi:hypothetical protein